MDALAELQFFHSRPFAPTRRLALGDSTLPVDPAPGPGGILLGAVVARHRDALDEDGYENLLRLTLQIQEGQRIVQPRLRHRFQTDRHGLTRSRARLVRHDDRLVLDIENEATEFQLIVAAVYAAGELPFAARRAVMDAIRKGMRWNGSGGDRALFAHLAGLGNGRTFDADVYDDPVQWALRTLGLAVERNGSLHLPDRTAIQKQFRVALRDAHPDHGGDTDAAAGRIDDLTEARRILLS